MNLSKLLIYDFILLLKFQLILFTYVFSFDVKNLYPLTEILSILNEQFYNSNVSNEIVNH